MSEQPPGPEHPHEDATHETRENPMNESHVDATQPLRGPASGVASDPASDPAPTLWDEGRHPVHVAHLVIGIAFAGLLLVWALLYTGAADGDDVRWLLPLPWLLAGTAGLAAAGRNARRRA